MFINKDFLLESKSAAELYGKYAKDCPIIDYHCHLSPKEIAEDKHFTNIGEIWLSGDHYKWRAMRECGVDERYITGNASDYEKFKAFCSCMPSLIGNPLYHWAHLELHDSFGCDLVISEENCDAIWNYTSDYIIEHGMSARSLISRFDVRAICTTDDPADSLEYHESILKENLPFKVCPTFRPDNLFSLNAKDYPGYIERLSKRSGVRIEDLKTLCAALEMVIDDFDRLGCVTSDHGFNTALYFEKPNEFYANEIFTRALSGKGHIEDNEITLFTCQMMRFFASEYKKRDWVMQWHIGALRNPNRKMLKAIGKDSGYDSISGKCYIAEVAELLNYLEDADILPRTIMYSLNPNDNAALAVISGAFCKGGRKAPYVTQGIAWWFNDTYSGMRNQLISYAELMPLGKFIGMETDSRSFLSYSRHGYFRRILCNLVGEWMERGFIPNDMAAAGKIISDICYNNAKEYFGF